MANVEQAEHLMRKGYYQKAKSILYELISENPDDLRAICDIGIAYTETGENTKAIKALEHYINNDRNNTYAWEALGCARFRTGELQLAHKNLLLALEIMPNNHSALRNLGILQGMKKCYKESIETLQRSIRIEPNDYRTLYALNFTFRDSGMKTERLRILQRLADMETTEKIRYYVAVTLIKLSIGWE